MKQYKVGIIGATGMVGQRFVTLMENHPWFQLTAHRRLSPLRGQDAMKRLVAGRWAMRPPSPTRPRTWWSWTPRPM